MGETFSNPPSIIIRSTSKAYPKYCPRQLLNLGSRQACLAWLRRHGYPEPPKSACIGCPFHSDAVWREMRDNDPESWDDAVSVDHALRATGPCRGMRALQFMHPSREPLHAVDLSTAEEGGQLNLFLNECEGMCGV